MKELTKRLKDRRPQILDQAEEIEAKSIQEQASEHVDGAIKTLAKFSKGQKVRNIVPSAATVYNASKSIIEFAGGRPETRDPRVGDANQGVQIYIQQFGSDRATSIEAVAPVDVTDLSSHEAALAKADHALETVSKTFEVKRED